MASKNLRNTHSPTDERIRNSGVWFFMRLVENSGACMHHKKMCTLWAYFQKLCTILFTPNELLFFFKTCQSNTLQGNVINEIKI